MDRPGPESTGEADAKPPIAHVSTNTKFDLVWDDAPDLGSGLFLISEREPVRGILAVPFNSGPERIDVPVRGETRSGPSNVHLNRANP